MRTDATFQALMRKLRSGTQQEKLQAIQLLGAEASDPRAVYILIEAVKLDDPLVQVRAIAAIPQSHLPDAIPLLQNLLTEDNSDLRRVAVQVLGKLRSETSLPQLAKRLNDENHWIRWDAIDAIAWQNEPWVAEAITPMLFDKDARVRRRACEVFAMGLAPLPIDDLIVNLTDPDQWVRFWAIEALRSAGDTRRAVRAVSNALFDHAPLVRDRAVRSLGYMLSAGAVPAFQKLAEQESTDEQLLLTLIHTLRRFETDEAQALRGYCQRQIDQLQSQL